jgi:RimJ/RimL family protein N-acetyltransferase
VGGLIHLDKKNRNAEVSIILGETKLHHRGLGTKALQLLINYGFQKLKLHRIEAEIFEYNKISVKLFEKLNFTREAILKDSLWRSGRWWNVYIFSIIND